MMNDRLSFSLSGAIAGARRTIALALGDAAFSIVFGMLARQSGLSLLESLMISGLVFAGAAQLIALGLWTTPLPILTIILTTLVVNLRHLLMGAALQPWFSRLSGAKAYGSAFFMTDETWALTMHELQAGSRDGAFLGGSGIALWLGGFIGTWLGFSIGSLATSPEKWGLDFMFVALFVTLLVGLWKGKSDMFPWATAAVVSLVAAYGLPGKWYILLGGIAGSLVGAFKDAT